VVCLRRRLPAGPELLVYVAVGVTGSVGAGDSSTLRGAVGGADDTSDLGTLRGSVSGTEGRGAVGESGSLRDATLGDGVGAIVGCEGVGAGTVTLVSTSLNSKMAGGKRCKRRARRRIFECIDNVVDAGKNQVVGEGNRHGSFGGEPTESIANACSSSGPNLSSITAIRVERGTSVPAIDAMGRPRVALRWLSDCN
jgi:hypothetical protein